MLLLRAVAQESIGKGAVHPAYYGNPMVEIGGELPAALPNHVTYIHHDLLDEKIGMRI